MDGWTKAARRARREDLASIRQLLYLGGGAYYYPGWRALEQWMTDAGLWVLSRGPRIDAALACTVDVPGVAWLRLFAVRSGLRPERAWNHLWDQAYSYLQQARVQAIYALGLDSWIESLLESQGWRPDVRLRKLLWEGRAIPPLPAQRNDVVIRVARESDVTAIARVNERAFERPWQIGKRVLPEALQNALLILVAEYEGRIVGYIMAMATYRGAHIPSFAVLPEYQGRGIGRLLLHIMLHRLWIMGYPWVTLNTQEENQVALQLYYEANFRDTGQQVRVWRYPLTEEATPAFVSLATPQPAAEPPSSV